MDRALLLTELTELLKKHGVWVSGAVKLRELSEWDTSTARLVITEGHGFFPYRDNSSLFLQGDIEQTPSSPAGFTKVTSVIIDRDRLLRDGVLSPLDMKTGFTNRRAWNEHLKANDCVEVGNDLNNATEKKRELQGDFDCRRELTQATQQVMGKYGH